MPTEQQQDEQPQLVLDEAVSVCGQGECEADERELRAADAAFEHSDVRVAALGDDIGAQRVGFQSALDCSRTPRCELCSVLSLVGLLRT